MPRASLLLAVLLGAAPLPAHAVRVGQQLPAPPGGTLAGDVVPTDRWLRDALTAWYLFEADDAGARRVLRWLQPPSTGAGRYHAAGVPLGPGSVPGGQPGDAPPLLADGERWRPQLRLDTALPVLIVTRPPGAVVAVYQAPEVTEAALALRTVTLHLQREDWRGAIEVISRAGAPLIDPTLHAARGHAALHLGDLTRARTEASGLAQVGPSATFKSAGHALLAELARRTGDAATAAAEARAGGDVAEAYAVRARLALAAGDPPGARALAQQALAREAVLPWSAGEHALLAANLAWLRDEPAAALTAATRAVEAAPAGWRAWQALGLARLRQGSRGGLEWIVAAAAIAPPGHGAAALAEAAELALTPGDALPPAVMVVLERGSVAHVTWPGAGPTACVLLARALEDRGVDSARAYAVSARGLQDGHPFGAPLDALAARTAAAGAEARYVVLLRMQASSRGVVMNVRVGDAATGALRGFDSMVWPPALTLAEACDELARRVRARLP